MTRITRATFEPDLPRGQAARSGQAASFLLLHGGLGVSAAVLVRRVRSAG